MTHVRIRIKENTVIKRTLVMKEQASHSPILDVLEIEKENRFVSHFHDLRGFWLMSVVLEVDKEEDLHHISLLCKVFGTIL